MVISSTGNKRFLVIFQYGFKKYLSLNQLSTMKVERIHNTEEANVTTDFAIIDDTFDS